MNSEQIRQLMIDAWEKAEGPAEVQTAYGKATDMRELLMEEQQNIFTEFAEAIVRECIGCCEQVISDPAPKSVDTWLNGGLQCIEEIKTHFEVEQ